VAKVDDHDAKGEPQSKHRAKKRKQHARHRATATAHDETASQGADQEHKRVADRLIELAEVAGIEWWHTPDGEPFVTVWVKAHQETYVLRDREFRHWLRHQYWRACHRAVRTEPVEEALAILEARALFAGAVHEVAVRVAEHDGAIYLDLADEARRVIEVTAAGWRVVETGCPVYFRRPKAMRALPVPVRGGRVDELRPWLHLGTDTEGETDWQLMVGWLLQALRLRGPFSILAFHGETGTGKTMRARILRHLIDPRRPDTHQPPDNSSDLMIAASHSWVILLDNVSSIPRWLSDALCRLATGGGSSKRTLYTDADESVLDVKRPIIVTSIEAVETADDLADRARSVTFSTISPQERRTEEAVWAGVARVQPRVLGALLDVAATGLRDLGTIQPTQLSRMADGATWMRACEPALGWAPGTYDAAVTAREQEAASVVLGSSVVGLAVVQLMEKHATWQGTATELLAALATLVSASVVRSWRWPSSPEALGGRLRRLAPVLRRKGLEVTFSRAGDRVGTRLIHIETIAADGADSSKADDADASDSPEDDAKRDRAADGADVAGGFFPPLGRHDTDVSTPPKGGKHSSAPSDCQQPRPARDQERDRAAAAGGGAARPHARRVAATRGEPKPDDADEQEPATTAPTPPKRPLWQRRPPAELDDEEAERWDNARRHVDPEREEYAADPLERQQWLAHLERLAEVATRRREAL
jgi:hypothetical protein